MQANAIQGACCSWLSCSQSANPTSLAATATATAAHSLPSAAQKRRLPGCTMPILARVVPTLQGVLMLGTWAICYIIATSLGHVPYWLPVRPAAVSSLRQPDPPPLRPPSDSLSAPAVHPRQPRALPPRIVVAALRATKPNNPALLARPSR